MQNFPGVFGPMDIYYRYKIPYDAGLAPIPYNVSKVLNLRMLFRSIIIINYYYCYY